MYIIEYERKLEQYQKQLIGSRKSIKLRTKSWSLELLQMSTVTRSPAPESSRWSVWIPVFIFSILDIVAYFGAANLDNFLIIASKTFLDHKLLIILILVTRQQRTGRCRRAYSCAVADKQRRKKSVLYWRCEMLVADPGPDL